MNKPVSSNQPGVVGGVCTAHAPQLWTLPTSEDHAIVERLKSLLGGIGEKLRALQPDVCVVVANDHAHQFLLHCTAGFTMHMGAEAKGSFAGRSYSYPVASELALDLVRHLQRNGYDPAFTSNAEIDYAFAIPLDFTGMAGPALPIPILPIYVNAYIPPQPSMERCYAFGQALADGIKALGARAVVITSGGLSHYPGTARYIDPGPDTDFDRRFMAIMAAGEVRYLLALDERRLDETGNIELRCWGLTAGMMGGRKPDITNFEPTWHHNYGTIAWTGEPDAQPYAPHYPPVRADRVVLTETLHRLVTETDQRDRYIADPAGYAQSVDGLTSEERDALVRLDLDEMIALGLHPFVPHAFRRVLERMGLREAPVPTKP